MVTTEVRCDECGEPIVRDTFGFHHAEPERIYGHVATPDASYREAKRAKRAEILARHERMTTVVHKARDPFSVYIGRPSPWGNPFVIGRDGDRAEVIAKHREWVLTSDDPKAAWVREHVHELRGKVLGCFCAPLPCHGDTLAEMAEQSPDESAIP